MTNQQVSLRLYVTVSGRWKGAINEPHLLQILAGHAAVTNAGVPPDQIHLRVIYSSNNDHPDNHVGVDGVLEVSQITIRVINDLAMAILGSTISHLRKQVGHDISGRCVIGYIGAALCGKAELNCQPAPA